MHNCLDERADGFPVSIYFSADKYSQKVYATHLATLRRLKKKNISNYHTIMAYLYQEARWDSFLLTISSILVYLDCTLTNML